MKILSIHFGHNATAALLVDGRVVFCQSEERLNRMKNSTGWPAQTLEHIFATYGRDIDLLVLPGASTLSFEFLKNQGFKSTRYMEYFAKTRALRPVFFLKFIWYKYFPKIAHSFLKQKTLRRGRRAAANERLRAEARAYFSKETGIPQEKIMFVDHHAAHAVSVLFNILPEKKTLVFTLDAEGDEACATVSVAEQRERTELTRIHKFNSLGHLYLEVTGLLGMKPNEDEYKVMGLAPYAKMNSPQVRRVYDEFGKIIRINDSLEFESDIPMGAIRYWLLDHFIYERFDNLAAGLQLFLEDIVCEWVRRWIKKEGVGDIALSGGVFMNVKLNQRLAEMEEVKSMFVMPSGSDESLVFGCAWEGYRSLASRDAFHPQPIRDLYLGMEFGEDQVEKDIVAYGAREKFEVSRPEDVDREVARLLAEKKIVARYAGRMEFGARALGNRSILANGSARESVIVINEMIKNRDFWMPFACSVLAEDLPRYFVNPKNIPAPYMILTFASRPEAERDLIAGLHQYDLTGRPQEVMEEWNPRYHALISEFKRLTGAGGILNTSFNLHGEPVACAPADALRTFELSGLEYLALDRYLIRKKK